ncbi:MAG: cytochrome oxidase assembly protein [Bacteroidia bacterium]|nr:MAG: cytochrome oxidase assembly protein [Bacteroidia bacterium]
MTNNKNLKRFLFWGVASVIMVYLVILAGAIVRGTGAGMGCPDWPKCFGLWIPPTDIAQLPDNYQTLFSDNGKVYVEPFNPIKTWTEYVNRLIGALSGLSLFIMLVFAFKIRKEFPKSFFLTLLAFALLLLQAWLGAKVVYTNLMPHMITYHMVLAMIIVGTLILSIVSTLNYQRNVSQNKLFFILLIFMFIQMVLGVLVREQIDVIMKKWMYEKRELWLSTVDNIFLVHRTFSWVILFSSLYFFYKLRFTDAKLHATLQLIGVIVLLVTGIFFQYFHFPAFAQPIHLLTTSLMIGNLFYGFAKTY